HSRGLLSVSSSSVEGAVRGFDESEKANLTLAIKRLWTERHTDPGRLDLDEVRNLMRLFPILLSPNEIEQLLADLTVEEMDIASLGLYFADHVGILCKWIDDGLLSGEAEQEIMERLARIPTAQTSDGMRLMGRLLDWIEGGRLDLFESYDRHNISQSLAGLAERGHGKVIAEKLERILFTPSLEVYSNALVLWGGWKLNHSVVDVVLDGRDAPAKVLPFTPPIARLFEIAEAILLRLKESEELQPSPEQANVSWDERLAISFEACYALILHFGGPEHVDRLSALFRKPSRMQGLLVAAYGRLPEHLAFGSGYLWQERGGADFYREMAQNEATSSRLLSILIRAVAEAEEHEEDHFLRLVGFLRFYEGSFHPELERHVEEVVARLLTRHSWLWWEIDLLSGLHRHCPSAFERSWMNSLSVL
ncbi:MAG: hypothetical protein ACNA8W_18190, partial [Bradymonadaceae bacterium]